MKTINPNFLEYIRDEDKVDVEDLLKLERYYKNLMDNRIHSKLVNSVYYYQAVRNEIKRRGLGNK